VCSITFASLYSVENIVHPDGYTTNTEGDNGQCWIRSIEFSTMCTSQCTPVGSGTLLSLFCLDDWMTPIPSRFPDQCSHLWLIHGLCTLLALNPVPIYSGRQSL